MAFRALTVICFVAVLALGVHPSRGDVVVRVEVKDANEKAEPESVLTVETLAGASGQFSTKTTVAKQTIVLKGDLKKQDNGTHRVHLTFTSQGGDGVQDITTLIEVPLNKPQPVGGLGGAGVKRSVILTLEEAPAAK